MRSASKGGPGSTFDAADPGPAGPASAVDVLAARLRRAILDNTLAPGTPLREQRLAAEHDAARHTVRAALRALVAQGLATAEANRGVRVRELAAADLEALGELRVALETEGARLALGRHGGRLPPLVHAALEAMEAACRAHASGTGPGACNAPTPPELREVVEVDRGRRGQAQPPPPPPPHQPPAGGWARVTDAHEALHHALVAASGSARIVAVHAALGAELRLFLTALRPAYDPLPLLAEHRALVRAIETDGPDVLRAHVAASTARLAARLTRS